MFNAYMALLVEWMQHSIVRRVDNALGLLLELRSEEEEAPAEQDQGAGGPGDTSKGKKKKKKQQKQTGGDSAKDGKAQPRPVAGYAHISAVSDTRIEKLDKVWATPLIVQSTLRIVHHVIHKVVCGLMHGLHALLGLPSCNSASLSQTCGLYKHSTASTGILNRLK